MTNLRRLLEEDEFVIEEFDFWRYKSEAGSTAGAVSRSGELKRSEGAPTRRRAARGVDWPSRVRGLDPTRRRRLLRAGDRVRRRKIKR